MNLAIAAPSASVYSETFITMQMEHIPNVLRIHGAPVAEETIPGGPIRPLQSFYGSLQAVWSAAAKKNIKESIQSAELTRRLRHAKVDCLLVNFGPMACNLLPLCRKLSIPLVVHFHGYDAHRRDVVNKHRAAYKELGQYAAAIVAVSNGMIDALVDIGIPREKIYLARCGVSPGQFTLKTAFPQKPLFFAIGRFVDKKAPYLSLLAFAKAHEQLPDAKLVMAGSGELLETTKNLARVLHLGDSVLFPGVIEPAKVAAYMNEATAFVQHSIEPSDGPAAGDREGTPVAVMEAMISGLPVISTRHAGIGEIIEHKCTGWLVEERDVEGMAQAMVAIGSSPEIASSLGRAAHAEALSNFTADKYLGTLKSIIESAL